MLELLWLVETVKKMNWLVYKESLISVILNQMTKVTMKSETDKSEKNETNQSEEEETNQSEEEENDSFVVRNIHVHAKKP